MHSKHHVVNNRLVNQVTDFHEARHRRHQAKHCHCKLIFYFRRLKKKEDTFKYFYFVFRESPESQDMQVNQNSCQFKKIYDNLTIRLPYSGKCIADELFYDRDNLL